LHALNEDCFKEKKPDITKETEQRDKWLSSYILVMTQTPCLVAIFFPSFSPH